MTNEDHMDDKHTGWQQGAFINAREYDHMPDGWKREQREREACLVRPSPKGNAICQAMGADAAQWIARRLNVAAKQGAEIERLRADNERLRVALGQVGSYTKARVEAALEQRSDEQSTTAKED